MIDEETAFKELISSTIEGVSEALKGKPVAVLGVMEFELSVVTKKTAGGKLKLLLAEAGANYQKEAVHKIKFNIGSKHGEHYKHLGWPM